MAMSTDVDEQSACTVNCFRSQIGVLEGQTHHDGLLGLRL